MIITKECFFLELRSNVVWYSISTKFFRHGTLTSFFTACENKSLSWSSDRLEKGARWDWLMKEVKLWEFFKMLLTAATGIRISTKRPARACFISLSLTSRKYWAHSWEEAHVEHQEIYRDTCRIGTVWHTDNAEVGGYEYHCAFQTPVCYTC